MHNFEHSMYVHWSNIRGMRDLKDILYATFRDVNVANLVARDTAFLNAMGTKYAFREMDVSSEDYGKILWTLSFDIETSTAQFQDHDDRWDESAVIEFDIINYSRIRFKDYEIEGTSDFTKEYEEITIMKARYIQEQILKALEK